MNFGINELLYNPKGIFDNLSSRGIDDIPFLIHQFPLDL